MVRLLTGRQLKKCFGIFCPFEKDGTLKPEDNQVTILASNLNPPIDLAGRSFVMAAAQGEQSPMIIQIHYNAMNLSGGAVSQFKPPEGVVRRTFPYTAVDGVKMTVEVLEHLVNQYGTKYVAISLDHFNVPNFDPNIYSNQTLTRCLENEMAQTRIKDALEVMEPTFGKAQIDERTMRVYVAYLSGPAYSEFKRDFLNVVAAISPAWGMIDTEKLPQH